MTHPAQHDQATGTADDRAKLRQDILDDIRRVHRHSLAGARALSLFLLVSTWAWWRFPLLPSREMLIALLGRPPSAPIISIAFITYTFFAIILSLSRMMTGSEHRGILGHIGYLTGFFFFYHASGALDDNYWAVFSAGITILGVEGYRVWQLCHELTARNRERLAYLEKSGRLPSDE